MTSAFRLGQSSTFTDATELVQNVVGYTPAATYTPGGTRVLTLAGLQTFVGYPRAAWTLAFLTVAQWETLKDLVGGLSALCYCETHDDENDWYVYHAIGTLPDPKTLKRWGGGYQDVVLELVLLAVVTPPA